MRQDFESPLYISDQLRLSYRKKSSLISVQVNSSEEELELTAHQVTSAQAELGVSEI